MVLMVLAQIMAAEKVQTGMAMTLMGGGGGKKIQTIRAKTVARLSSMRPVMYFRRCFDRTNKLFDSPEL